MSKNIDISDYRLFDLSELNVLKKCYSLSIELLTKCVYCGDFIYNEDNHSEKECTCMEFKKKYNKRSGLYTIIKKEFYIMCLNDLIDTKKVNALGSYSGIHFYIRKDQDLSKYII